MNYSSIKILSLIAICFLVNSCGMIDSFTSQQKEPPNVEEQKVEKESEHKTRKEYNRICGSTFDFVVVYAE